MYSLFNTLKPLGLTCLFSLAACSSMSGGSPPGKDQPIPFAPGQQEKFIAIYSQKLNLNPVMMRAALDDADYQPDVIRKMTKPAEGKSWGDYRKSLLTPRRIAAGKDFMKDYAPTFALAKKRYGVPPEIISSIIGVETFYGKNTGKYRLIDSLSTLCFCYPKRSAFFGKELANYLLIIQRNHWEPGREKGSYAGAFGWSQFMPSSYLEYAVSALPNAVPDLYNPNDAILSVANYFDKNGWEAGQPVAVRVQVSPSTCTTLTCNQRKPLYSVSTWKSHGVTGVPKWITNREKASLVTLKMDDGKEYWLIFNNFYVITKYNISINYAKAVDDLSRALKA